MTAQIATPSPVGMFSLFVIGIEGIVGLVLGQSTGLSELHKTILVAFLVGFPIVTLALFLLLARRTAVAVIYDDEA
ncbi:MAG: hypothetical protein ACRC14_16265 [Paracoccaceae bacterium]